MPYKQKIIRSGELIEYQEYFCTRNGSRIPRGENIAETPEDVEKVNDRRSKMQLNRLMCCNFSGKGGDMMVTFTHRNAMDEERAMKEERNLLARIGRARTKLGITDPFRWIAVTEKQGSWHHHIVLNGGISLEVLKEVWGDKGRMQINPLQNTYTYEELAKYLTEPHKPPKGQPEAPSAKPDRKKGRRRWHASLNLQKPEVTEKIMKRAPKMGEPTPPKNQRLLPGWVVGCDLFGNLYRYYSCVADGREVAKSPKAKAGGTNGVRGQSPGGARGRAPKAKQ